MLIYKIENITNILNKRDFMYNKVVNFQIIDGMIKKNIAINSGETLYIECVELPIDARRLELKGYIRIATSSKDVMNDAINVKKDILPKAEEKTILPVKTTKKQKKDKEI